MNSGDFSILKALSVSLKYRNGWQNFTVILLTALQSMHILQVPSYLSLALKNWNCTRDQTFSNISFCHELFHLPLKLFCFFLLPYAGLLGIVARRIKSIWYSIPLTGGKPRGVSLRNTSSNSYNKKPTTLQKEELLSLMFKKDPL